MNLKFQDPQRQREEFHRHSNHCWMTCWRNFQGTLTGRVAISLSPEVDLVETRGDIRLYLSVPGLSGDDIEFHIERANLTIDMPLLTALPGGKIDLRTVHGTVAMSIPARTSSDRVMRVRGQGIKGTDNAGDHLVRVLLDVPNKTFSDTQQSELRALLQP